MPPKRAQREDPRAPIVREAVRLTGARGFGAISIAEVAEAAGMSKQALMHHFRTKEALKEAVLAHLLAYANACLVSLMGELGPDSSGRLEQVLDFIQASFDREPAAAAVTLRFLLDGDEEAVSAIRDGVQPWLRFMTDELHREQLSGRVRKDLDVEAAVAQVGMLVLTNFALLPIHGWTKSSPREWRKRRLAELVRAIQLILFAPAPPPPRR